MRKISIMERAQEHWQQKRILYLLLISCLVIGIISGVLYATMISEDKATDIVISIEAFLKSVQNEEIDLLDILKTSLFENMRIFIIITVLGLHHMLVTVDLGIIGLKGFPVGFTMGFMIVNFGFKGFLLAITSVLPQIFMLIPLLLFFAVQSFDFARERRDMKKKNSYNRSATNLYRNYITKLVIGIGLLFVIALIDALIIPVFMRGISNLFLN